MQILISVAINIIILSITLPLFYIYIVSRVREKLERETMKRAKDEIEALLKEFNNTALTQITTLEDVIIRAKKIVKNINNEIPQIKEDIKKEKLIILENRTVESEEDIIDIEINDNKEVFEAQLEKKNKLAEFISADRSALSRELSRLDKENIIKIEGNKATIIEDI